MALASSQFTSFRRWPLAPGRWGFSGTFTGPASYAAGGELLTNAIWKAATGLNGITRLQFTHAVPTAATTVTVFSFDHTPTAATNQGKIHAYAAGQSAHTHSFLVKGGQAAAGTDAISIKGTTPVTVGKEAATDATNIGGAGGGVQTSTSDTAGAELAAATNLSTFVAHFGGEGY